MRPIVFTLALLTLIVGTAHRSEAMCGNPTWVGTESGTVPTHGALYVYDRSVDYRDTQIEVSWRGTTGVVSQTKVASGVMRVDYTGAAGSELVVDGQTYRLTNDWHAPSESPR